MDIDFETQIVKQAYSDGSRGTFKNPYYPVLIGGILAQEQ